MKARHTRGKWLLDGVGSASVVTEQGNPIAHALDPDDNVHQTAIAEANATLIAAAVNACDGIPTEALEGGIVKEMREALGECQDLLFESKGGRTEKLFSKISTLIAKATA